MSQYLNKQQQERLNRIVDEFTVHSGVKREHPLLEEILILKQQANH